MAKRVSNRKIIDDYIQKHPTKEAIIEANLAGLIRYTENRQERNSDFIAKWKQVQKHTNEYLKNLKPDMVGSKEYKNVIDIYMSMINHHRPSDEDAIILQLIASFDRLQAEGQS